MKLDIQSYDDFTLLISMSGIYLDQGCAIMIDRDRSSKDRRLDQSKGSVRRSIVA